MPERPPAVYLHVGPPKTGTTFLQDVLWQNRGALGARGLSVPGARLVDHFNAALDLRGIAFGGHEDPAVPGSWARLAGKARTADAKAVLTHEVFAGAQVDQIGHAVESLAPAEVHVVYAVRDLGRQLPAVWQEGLKNRRTRTFDRFLERTLAPDAAPDRGFWRAQHPLEVLGRWSHHVPAERIHVVTLPPPGAPGGSAVLWERFCGAVGVDGGGLDLEVARSNTSLNVVDAEVLRLLNQALDDVDWPTYELLVKRRFNRRADEVREGRRPRVPPAYRDVVLARSEAIVAGLRRSGFDIVGDLDDLRPRDESFGRGAAVSAAKVAETAVGLLAETLVAGGAKESATGRARSLLGRLRGEGTA